MLKILTTCFNAEEYIESCIRTLQMQSEKEWVCYITDDLSTDNSINIIKKIISKDNRFVLIENTRKYYQVGNYWQVLQRPEIDDDDICITVDGDDWLPDPRVFERVLSYYTDKNIWLSYGQFLSYEGNGQYNDEFKSELYSNSSPIRQQPWVSSHLRTFKAGLFRKINKKDLLSQSFDFWPSAGDLAMMYPMLEMAGKDRIHCSNDINYIYNRETPLNDHKCTPEKQIHSGVLIRNKRKYKTLSNFSQAGTYYSKRTFLINNDSMNYILNMLSQTLKEKNAPLAIYGVGKFFNQFVLNYSEHTCFPDISALYDDNPQTNSKFGWKVHNSEELVTHSPKVIFIATDSFEDEMKRNCQKIIKNNSLILSLSDFFPL